ncbi:hypothetical protein K493DRAFT_410459 [Basidiobolus meristosporus CBS 931.73]|uniref:PH domain-containing protein n=1 Tax=Basidiobolus meristosporus CBS 931.73 TaxID=1314790 RepID=A0A1Y1XUH2_9FUNG|nr:hypothetical protein K493DRAFT_410459 [Basidiobolus meristosporus CBS 931.73]|eukprot:ORX89398.1 hypothetical protein K493DRAFT_410459 [Basidiobolus meristosporus CBS 931.73]
MTIIEGVSEGASLRIPGADFSSDDEIEYENDASHELIMGYDSNQNSPQPTMRRFRSFSAGKLVVPSNLTAETQLRDLEARLVEKENEVLLAADIGQVLLKEIDSLKHKLTIYEQNRTSDELNQEIEAKHAETLQKLRTFRVEAEIYTCSFEKPNKNGNSPYGAGRRGERSVTPQLPGMTDSELDLARIPSPTMLPTKNTTSTLHSEINRSVEVGENLMRLSRQLQAKLLEAERESLNLAERVTDQERQTMAFKMQLVRGAESEAKSQETSWNLELSNQELQTQVEELEQVMQKLTNDHVRLQEALNHARESIEMLHLKEEKMTQTMERTKTRHEQELTGVRKLVTTLQGEKAELQRRLEEAKQERNAKACKHTGKYLNHAVATLDTRTVGHDSTLDLSDGHDHSPIRSPSPSPFAGNAPGQTLQVETLRGSLNHAHRTIASLRACLHREKIEKLELKKMLSENQEALENLQQDSLLEAEGDSTIRSFNDCETPRRSMPKKARHRKRGNKRASAPVLPNRRLRFPSTSDGLYSSEETSSTFDESPSYKQSINSLKREIPTAKLEPPVIKETVSSSDGDQRTAELSARRNTRNPLARRSAHIPQPNRDLLNELSMVDGNQPDDPTGSHDQVPTQSGRSNGDTSGKESQILRNLTAKAFPNLCDKCGSIVESLISGHYASSVAESPEDTFASKETTPGAEDEAIALVEELRGKQEGLGKDRDSPMANAEDANELSGELAADGQQLLSKVVTSANAAPIQAESQPKLSVSVDQPPPRPTTLPPAELMALTKSPITLRNSDAHEGEPARTLNPKRPPIPTSMLQPAGSRKRTHSKGKRAFYGKEIDTEMDSSMSSRPTSKRYSQPALDDSYSRYQPLRRPNAQAMHHGTMNSCGTESSYFGDEASWSERRRTFSADPAIIHAITQAMIGNFMYKYTRKAIGNGISEKKHKRYFWIHPYTKTINWSEEQPGPEKTYTRNSAKSKSAYVKSVRVVQEPLSPTSPTTQDQAGYEYSLIVETSTRELKIKAMDSEKHDVWLLALTYIQTRQVISEGAADYPQIAETPLERNSRPALPVFPPSSTTSSPQSLSKKRSLTRLFKRPSKPNLHGTLATMEFPPSAEDLEALEDIRKCCNGKHDINRLETVTH